MGNADADSCGCFVQGHVNEFRRVAAGDWGDFEFERAFGRTDANYRPVGGDLRGFGSHSAGCEQQCGQGERSRSEYGASHG